jgi:RNA polymerase primary sigma factor
VRKYKKIERERFLRSGVDPGFKEVVSAMGITPVEAVRLQKAFRFERVASLDVSPQGSGQGDDEGGPLSSLIPDTSSPTPEEQLTEMYLSEDIERVLAGLTRRDRDMLRMRMGVNGEKATLEKVGARFGVTRERVRQIMKAILRKVHTRAHLGDETFDEFRKKNK